MGTGVLPDSGTPWSLGARGEAQDRWVSRHGPSRCRFSVASVECSLFAHPSSFISHRFCRQSLATNPPRCRRGSFFRVTQHNRRGMEKAVPNFSERQGDGGRALLMPPEPDTKTFPALECPQGQERRAAFLHDAKKPLENLALSGTSVAAETELEEDAFYVPDDPETMSGEEKGPSGAELRPLREEPDFFSSLARQEPDVALEAHDVAGKSQLSAARVVSRGTGSSAGASLRSVWVVCQTVAPGEFVVGVGSRGVEMVPNSHMDG